VLDRTSWFSTIQSLTLTQGDDVPRVRDITDPISLGVHPAASIDELGVRELDLAPAVPTYVPRDVDDILDAALGRAKTGRAFVLVIGDSATGKTRVAYEAMRRTVPDWRLIVPGSRASLAALLNVDVPLHDTVVWLDDLERFLGPDGLTVKLLDRLAGDRTARVAVLATMRAAEWRAITNGMVSGLRAESASIERFFHFVRLSRHFTSAEQARANERAWDPRIAQALAATRSSHEIPELLVASLRLLERWRHADALDNPSAMVGGAIVSAAIDCRRAGFLRPIPEALLHELYSEYLASRSAHPVDRHVFQRGLAWATTPVVATTALLTPAADGYAVADYLVATRETDAAAPPVSRLLWERIPAYLHEDDALTVARAAEHAGQMLVAERAYRKAADGGHTSAMRALGHLAEHRGDLSEAITFYRRAVTAGDADAATDLARLKKRRGGSGEEGATHHT
jgi:eukaryotic-like serine/threonine-protein kinase